MKKVIVVEILGFALSHVLSHEQIEVNRAHQGRKACLMEGCFYC